MTSFIFAVLLIVLALLALTLEKTYFYLTPIELKRLAKSNDQLAKTLFSAEAYGNELKVLLWLIIGLCAAGGFVLFARVAPSLFGFLAIVLILWLAFLWIPRTRLTVLGTRIAEWCTPAVVRLLRFLHPVMAYLALYLGRFPMAPHTGLYERDDFYELLRRQKTQNDNRISDQELELMRRILKFGDYHVRDLMVPRRHVKSVDVTDNIGPVLLDELHATGHTRFPVNEGKTNIVGTFAVDDVPDINVTGKVRDFYERRVAYAHQEDSLEDALRAFAHTHQHLLVVVNSFNEYVGIVTLSDILNRLLGEVEKSLEDHDDRKAVANRHSQPEPVTEPEATAEIVPTDSPEMVE